MTTPIYKQTWIYLLIGPNKIKNENTWMHPSTLQRKFICIQLLLNPIADMSNEKIKTN